MATVLSIGAITHLTRKVLLTKVRKRRTILITLICFGFFLCSYLEIELGELHSEKLIKQLEGPLLCPFMCLSLPTVLLSPSLFIRLISPFFNHGISL